MRLRRTIGHQAATATLEDNPVAHDLMAVLPVTLAMHDLFGREKPDRLPRALSGNVEPLFTYDLG